MKEKAAIASRQGGAHHRALAGWKAPTDFTIPIYSGPLALATALERIAAMVMAKKIPPKIASVMVQALTGAARAYSIAVETQRALPGEAPPIVLQDGARTGKLRLVFDWEDEAKQIEGQKGTPDVPFLPVTEAPNA